MLPSVRCLPSGWTIGLRRRPSPQAATLDRQLRPPYLRLSLRHGSTMQRPRGRTLLRGISLAQTPPGLSLSNAVAGAVLLVGTAGRIDLARQGRSAECRSPHSARRAWSTFGPHPYRNPAPIVRFKGASSRHLTVRSLPLRSRFTCGNAGLPGGGPLITRTEEARVKIPSPPPHPDDQWSVGRPGRNFLAAAT